MKSSRNNTDQEQSKMKSIEDLRAIYPPPAPDWNDTEEEWYRWQETSDDIANSMVQNLRNAGQE